MTTKNARRIIVVALVMVLSTLLGSAALAQTVTPTPTLSVGEFEFFGTISALSATSITVNGRVFDISRAELNTSLSVGLAVKVHASLNASGVWVAREVEQWDGQQFDDDGEAEIFGTVTALTVTTITIDGVIFDISQAELKTRIAIGDFVKIHATQDASGIWIAREVEDWNPLLGDVDDDDRGRGSDDDDDDRGRGSDDDGDDDRGGRGSDDDGDDDSGRGRGSDDDGSGDSGRRGSDDDHGGDD